MERLLKTRGILWILWLVAFPAAVYPITCERALSEVGRITIPGEPPRQSTRQIFNETLEQGLSPGTKSLVDKIETAGLLPDPSFFSSRGIIGRSYVDELQTTHEFIRSFQAWKDVLRHNQDFSGTELERAGMDVFLQALLRSERERPSLMTSVFNLSLVADDLYGSHLYEMDTRIDLGNMADFMALRRKLAVAQGVVFLKAELKESRKKAMAMSEMEKTLAAAMPVAHEKDDRVHFIEMAAGTMDAMHLPFKALRHEILSAVEPSTPVDPIGRSLAKQYLEKPWVQTALAAFKEKMTAHKAALLNEKGPASEALLAKNVFDLALEVTSGDREQAVILVGLMSIQRKALNRGLSKHYSSAGTLDRHAQPLLDTVSVYYQITELAEVTDAVRKQRGLQPDRYSFLYPKPYRSTDNKFYHFWSEAFFATHLRGKGFPAWETRFGLSTVGTVYELATSVSGLQFFEEFGMNKWRALGATRMFDDMALHRMGAAFGSNTFDEAKHEALKPPFLQSLQPREASGSN